MIFSAAQAMQLNIHGTGTILYGRRDFWPDGSFITTEWVTLAYIPLFPTFSKRIAHTQNSPYAKHDASGHYVYETTSPDPTQVLCVYSFFVSLIVWFVVMANYSEWLERWIGDKDRTVMLLFLALAPIAAMPYLLRRRARRRLEKEWARARLGLGPSDGL